jgi:hypothetical protein
LPDQASLAKEFVNTQQRHHGFFAVPGDNGDFDLAFFDVENRVRKVALREENFALCMRGQRAAFSSRLKKFNRIELCEIWQLGCCGPCFRTRG